MNNRIFFVDSKHGNHLVASRAIKEFALDSIRSLIISEDIMVVVGGVIPAQDYQFLFDKGAVAVFGPGTKISEAAIKILEILIE